MGGKQKKTVPNKPQPMEALRMVDTPVGGLTYGFLQKAVKNLDVRVSPRGAITLSVPRGYPVEQADAFIQTKSGWIKRVLSRQNLQEELLPKLGRQECEAVLRQAVENVYPLVAPLGVRFPQIKLRALRSQWGNCHWRQGYITLNTALVRCPKPLREYVALHELVHFLHHDHGAGFYEQMDHLMPDWKQRRKMLRRYGQALEPEK